MAKLKVAHCSGLRAFVLACVSLSRVHGDCQDIDGGGWKLVRHTQGEWYMSQDGLVGTEDYNGGCEDQDPLSSIPCALPFADEYADNPSGQFLFSNGDCSQWLITTYDQFSEIRSSPYSATITKSSYRNKTYTADWYKRCTACGDPWIGLRDHCRNYGCLDVLYAEDSTLLHTERFNSDNINNISLNVWVKQDEFELASMQSVRSMNAITARNGRWSGGASGLIGIVCFVMGMIALSIKCWCERITNRELYAKQILHELGSTYDSVGTQFH